MAGFLANWSPRHPLSAGWSIFVSLLIVGGKLGSDDFKEVFMPRFDLKKDFRLWDL